LDDGTQCSLLVYDLIDISTGLAPTFVQLVGNNIEVDTGDTSLIGTHYMELSVTYRTIFPTDI